MRINSFVSQSVSDPAVETPIFLPLRSPIARIGESQGTPMLRNGTVLALSQTASIGAPLATNAISVPAPSPMSMLPAAIA